MNSRSKVNYKVIYQNLLTIYIEHMTVNYATVISDLQKHLSSTSTSNNRPPGAPGSPSPGTSRHSEHPWMMNPASGNDSLFRDSRAMHQKDIISQSGIW